jgi:hypothetical protein
MYVYIRYHLFEYERKKDYKELYFGTEGVYVCHSSINKRV